MPTVPFGGNARVLFNDGEGADYNDLNDMGKFAQKLLTDNFLCRKAYPGDGGITARTDCVYSVSGAGAVMADIPARTLTCGEGTIMTYPSGASDLTDPANNPQFLMYSLKNGEISVQLDAFGANNRIDSFCVKLEIATDDTQLRDFKDASTGALSSTSDLKKTYIKFTPQLIKGTEAASPVMPSVPAGFIRLFSYFVNSGFTSGASADELKMFDHRMPLGFQRVYIPAASFNFVAADWVRGVQTIGNNNGLVASAGSKFATASIPIGAGNARVLGITPFMTLTGVGFVNVTQEILGTNGLQVLDNHTYGNFTTGTQASFISNLAIPLWVTGEHAGMANSLIAGTKRLVIQVKSGTSADIIYGVQIDLAVD